VAIARALIRRPQLVIADEPTANLDSQSGAAFIDLLRHMQAQYKTSFLFSTHDPRLSKVADDVLVVKDGKVYVKKRRPVSHESRYRLAGHEPDGRRFGDGYRK
jgi:putative ABC transport system ATP-binding protein